MRRFLVFSFILLLASFLSSNVFAAKPRIRKTTAVRSTGVSYSSARLSRATNSVVLSLLNLNGVSRVTYTLSYSANGVSQGVVGTVVPQGQTTDSRDLYFGTCSHGVCTAHYNIRNATLLVETTLTSGAVHTKRYRIKV